MKKKKAFWVMGIEPVKTIPEVGVLCSQAGEAARTVTAETSLWIRREDTMDRACEALL